MFRVNFCHGVQAGAGCIGVATFGQSRAFKSHSFFHFGREKVAGFQEEQLVVEVAKGILRFQVQ